MESKVKENQLIEILSLALMDPGSSVTSAPDTKKLLIGYIQEYGLWGSQAEQGM